MKGLIKISFFDFSKKNFFRKKEERSGVTGADDALLIAMLGGNSSITKKEALEIPAVNACVNLIADCVSMLPIKLYEERDGEVKEITADQRLTLLNKATGDTLNGTEMKKRWVMDYLLGKGAYTYINRDGSGIKSLHYVDEASVSIQPNYDPIFKSYTLNIQGRTYYPYEFIKICRKADGKGRGTSVIEESSMIMRIFYNSMKLENGLVKKGGNKKGYLESENSLGKDEIDRLKKGLTQLYSNSADVAENVVVLNKGVKFHESSATSVEMQMNESKQTNSAEICKLFNVPADMITGKAALNAEKVFVNGLYDSVTATSRVAKTKSGAILKKAYFKGYETRTYEKPYKRSENTVEVAHALKAMALEYGTSYQKPKPFLADVIQSSEGVVVEKMQEIFNEEAAK